MAGFSLGGKLRNIFRGDRTSEIFYENLEDVLIEGDLGASTVFKLVDILRNEVSTKKISTEQDFLAAVKGYLENLIISEHYVPDPEKMNVLLVLGVNGVGKTTSIAKMAHYFKNKYQMDSVLSAADTFRAAAIEQLSMHGDRLGMRVVSQRHGADPGAVVYDTLESAASKKGKMVIIDTAGRMHNRENLVRELQKIDRIVKSKAENAVYRKILVIDATTGQNGMRQTEIFHEAVGLDGIILTKYDSASKGGIIVSVSRDLGVPVLFVGTGEKYDDFEEFNRNTFLDTLLDLK